MHFDKLAPRNERRVLRLALRAQRQRAALTVTLNQTDQLHL